MAWSLAKKKTLHHRLTRVPGGLVIVGALSALIAVLIGATKHEDHVTDPAAADAEKKTLQAAIDHLHGTSRSYDDARYARYSYNAVPDDAKTARLKDNLSAEAAADAVRFTFAPQVSTRDLSHLTHDLHAAANGTLPGYVLDWPEENFAAIHMCQKDALSKPGAVMNAASAQEVSTCSAQFNHHVSEGMFWWCAFIFAGVTAKTLTQYGLGKNIKREETALTAANLLVTVKSADVNDKGEVHISVGLSLDQDLKVRKPLKLKGPKASLFGA